MTINRAYSLLEVKGIDEDKRVLTGIATTPAPDRVGDIVEPQGAQFKLPIPLLWQHDSGQPIGSVVSAKVTKAGIEIVAQFAQIAEPGKLKERLDEAWQSIKARLVRGLSIGFRPIEHSMLDDSYSFRFTKWEWLELSAVTIPANAEATIQSLKSADAPHLRAALGATQGRAVRFDLSPGASGKPAAPAKGNDMKTYKEQIAAAEATRTTKQARMRELIDATAEKGEVLDAQGKQEFDTLKAEVGELNDHIKRLQDMDALNLATATVVETEAGKSADFGSGARVAINAKLEPGIRFARMAMCVARAKHFQREGQFATPADIYRGEKRWMDTAPEVHLALKSAVNGLDSTTSAAASEWAYAQNIASEFVEYLRPLTLLGKIQGWRNVPFNVRVGGMDGGTTGYWTGQGLGIPVSKPTSTSISLGITKVGGISVMTKELAMLSSPSAEAMVKSDLGRAIQQKADTSLIDPNAGGTTNVQPASLTYGVTARLASGTDFAAFKADWKALTTNFYANNIPLAGAVVIMKEELAEALSLMVTSLGLPQFPSMQDWASGNGRLMGRPVFTTQVADTSGSPDFDNLLILLQPNQVFLADDGGASVEASDQVSLQMDDAPSLKSTPTATGASVVSMFQTDSIALKALRHVNWAKARSQACQFIRTAAYV